MLARVNYHGGWLDPFSDLVPSAFRFFIPEERTASAWAPPVDVIESKDKVELVADLPGLKQEQISLSVEKGVLTLKAERQAPAAGDDVTVSTERPHGVFERAFTLSDELDPEHIEARYDAGVLRVTLTKRPQVLPRRIEVA